MVGGGYTQCIAVHTKHQETMSLEQSPSKKIESFFLFVSHHDWNLIRRVHFIIYNGRRHLSKNKAAGRMGTINGCEATASQTLIGANSCNKHTINSTVQPHSRYFCHSVLLYRPCLRRRRPFLQADISLKRYCPWKIWPFILMSTQINDPKSTTVSQKQYTGIYST